MSDTVVRDRRLLERDGAAADIAWHVPLPSQQSEAVARTRASARFPLGRDANGIEIAGDLLHWVGDGEYVFDWALSWSGAPTAGTATGREGGVAGEPSGYDAIGLRCVCE